MSPFDPDLTNLRAETYQDLIARLMDAFRISTRNPDHAEFRRLGLSVSQIENDCGLVTYITLTNDTKSHGIRLTLPPYPAILDIVHVSNLDAFTFHLDSDRLSRY